MSGDVNEARLRRRVVGRSHRLAAVCPPGFEDECIAELRELGAAVDPGLSRDTVAAAGGVVEFDGKLDDIYRICLGSACISRLRVRLEEFHAGAREELFRKAAAFPWELWLNALPLAVESHVEYSRISHEGMAAQTLYEAIERRLREQGLSVPKQAAGNLDIGSDETEELVELGESDKTARVASSAGPTVAQSAPLAPSAEPSTSGSSPAPQKLLLRIVNNRVSISLDASGEHQHRRGWRLFSGFAPIRENLAAGILRAAGWPGGYNVLVDGMCGSGTLAIEAHLSAQGLWSGGRRRFAFEDWPAHQHARWNWLLRQQRPASADRKVYANEIDEQVLHGAQGNAERAGAVDIGWSRGDFFELDPASFTMAGNTGAAKGLDAGERLLVLNPPYGKRIGENDVYSRLCVHLTENWRRWTVAVLAPAGTPAGPLMPYVKNRRTFRHGGLRIELWICSL